MRAKIPAKKQNCSSEHLAPTNEPGPNNKISNIFG
jgi:hypothetical protein